MYNPSNAHDNAMSYFEMLQMWHVRLALQGLMPLTTTPPRHSKKGSSSSFYSAVRRCSTLCIGVLYFILVLCRFIIFLSVCSSDACLLHCSGDIHLYKYFHLWESNSQMLCTHQAQLLTPLTTTPPRHPPKRLLK